MQASLVICSNPFVPSMGRQVMSIRRRRRVDKLAPATPLPFVCNYNGKWLLRRDWKRTCVEDGDVLQFICVPQLGGDSGDGEKNPLATVAMIALMVVAPYAAGVIGVTGFAAQVVTAAIVFAGSALINAAFGGTKPTQPSSQQMTAAAAPSPTYTVQAQGNSARLGQAISDWYGYNQIFPDFAAMPYQEFAGNDQFLYQLLAVGQGFYDIATIKIGDTSITSFSDVTYEIVEPGGAVTLFPTNVITSEDVAGQELVDGSVYIGPFTAVDAGVLANALAVDVVAPRGLFFANDNGSLGTKSVSFDVEAREIDNGGAPLGGWVVLGSETLSAATPTPQRASFRYAVDEGRYEVRVKRTDVKDTSSRAGHELDWVGLRSYIPGVQEYGDITLIAIRIRASDQLSNTSARRINVLATRKLPLWDPDTGWSAPTATRSIAAAAANICRASYGGDMADSALDLAKLFDLDETWADRGDYFDAGFDQQITLDEALGKVLRAGRAQHYRQGGFLRFVRDEAATVPVAMFTPRNIIPGSWETQYILPDENRADSIEAHFWQKDVWADRSVIAKIDSEAVPEEVTYFGIIERPQVWREAMYDVAASRYRTALHKFQTELEGLIPSPLDLVAISRDRPDWGQWGAVESFTGDDGSGGLLAGAVIELDVPVTFGVGAHYVAFRTRTGGRRGPYAVTAGADDTHLVVTGAIAGWQPDTPATYSGEPTAFAFGPSTKQYMLGRVVPDSIRVRSDLTVELTVVAEDDRVHTADGGDPPEEDESMGTPTVPDRPTIFGDIHVMVTGTAEAPMINASWPVAAGAESYLVEYSVDPAVDPEDKVWSRVGNPTTTNRSFLAQPGDAFVRVAPVGASVGDWVYWEGTVEGAPQVVTPTSPAGLAAFGLPGVILLTWTAITEPGLLAVEVLRNDHNDSTTADVIATVYGDLVTSYVDSLGDAGLHLWYWIRARNARGVGPVSTQANATTTDITGVPDAGTVTEAMLVSGFVYTKALNVNNRFTVDASGNVVISSAASGQRLEMTNSLIEVYDSGGNLRVQLGLVSGTPELFVGDPSGDYMEWDGSELTVKGKFSGVDYAPGTVQIASADTPQTRGTAPFSGIVKSIQVARKGTLTVKFDLYSGAVATVVGQVYINGAAAGTVQSTSSLVPVTYSEDIPVAVGDEVQLFITNGAGGHQVTAQNFRLYNDVPVQEAVITD